jgi:hypothetical protein
MHILLDKQSQTPARRIELFIMYLLAISVGANGLVGAFGHLLLNEKPWPLDPWIISLTITQY